MTVCFNFLTTPSPTFHSSFTKTGRNTFLGLYCIPQSINFTMYAWATQGKSVQKEKNGTSTPPRSSSAGSRSGSRSGSLLSPRTCNCSSTQPSTRMRTCRGSSACGRGWLSKRRQCVPAVKIFVCPSGPEARTCQNYLIYGWTLNGAWGGKAGLKP
jgi:hypothetical protein